MVGKRLDIRVIEDLPLLDLGTGNLPDIIVFYSGVKIPLIKPNDIITDITADPKIEYLDYMPYGYRKNYLHPGLFHIDLVEPKIKEKLKKLREWLHQKNNKLYFCITPETPDSVHNACSYLGYLFADCKNPDTSESRDITNIPYPLKISTYSEDHYRDWIWSCYWPSDLGMRITHNNLPDGSKLLEFPDYCGRYFPIRPCEKAEDGGVIMFSVAVGINGGEVIVVPQHLLEKHLPTPGDDVTLYIKDIPEVLTGPRIRKYVTITLKYKDYDDTFKEVNLYWFIRFMYIYYCTQQKDSFQYKLDDRKLVEVNFPNNNLTEWYKFLLNSESNEPDTNFPVTIKKIIKKCINPKAMKDKEKQTTIYDLVCHQKLSTETGFIDLNLTNLKVIFSHKAWAKMKTIKIECNLTVINSLKGCWPGFLDMVSSVAPSKDINE